MKGATLKETAVTEAGAGHPGAARKDTDAHLINTPNLSPGPALPYVLTKACLTVTGCLGGPSRHAHLKF